MAFPQALLVAVSFMIIAIILVAMHLLVPIFLDDRWPFILCIIIGMLHILEGTLAWEHRRQH